MGVVVLAVVDALGYGQLTKSPPPEEQPKPPAFIGARLVIYLDNRGQPPVELGFDPGVMRTSKSPRQTVVAIAANEVVKHELIVPGTTKQLGISLGARELATLSVPQEAIEKLRDRFGVQLLGLGTYFVDTTGKRSDRVGAVGYSLLGVENEEAPAFPGKERWGPGFFHVLDETASLRIDDLFEEPPERVEVRLGGAMTVRHVVREDSPDVSSEDD